LERHGVNVFSVGQIRNNGKGSPQLIIGIPPEADFDVPTVDDEITTALRNAGLGYIMVLFSPIQIDR